MNIKEEIIYDDLWFKVEYNWEDSNDFLGLNFAATKITGMFGNTIGEIVQYDFEKEPMLTGTVKRDGCMDIQMKQQHVHFCHRYIAKQYTDLFDIIYDKAKKLGCDVE